MEHTHAPQASKAEAPESGVPDVQTTQGRAESEEHADAGAQGVRETEGSVQDSESPRRRLNCVELNNIKETLR